MSLTAASAVSLLAVSRRSCQSFLSVLITIGVNLPTIERSG